MRVLGALTLLFLSLGVPPAMAGRGDMRKMELISPLGRVRSLKIYSGETVTLRVQERRAGIDGIFSPGEYLRGVTFTLRSWPRIAQDAHAITKGAHLPVIRTQRPGDELWGAPPSSFTIEVDKPERYLLTATKPGFQPAKLVIHLAKFELVGIKGELGSHYRVSFRVLLVDPDEKGKTIPLFVESLSLEGRVIDARDDLGLAPVSGKPGHYRSNRTIRISSIRAESFRSRLRRREENPLPPQFFDRWPLRISTGGAIRIGFRQVHAVYPLPFGL